MESTRKFIPKGILILAISIVFLAFEYYIGILQPLNYVISKPIHLYLALILCFLYKPLASYKNGKAWMWAIDGLLILASVAVLCYLLINTERFIYRIPSVDEVYSLDIAAALITLVCILEAVRRIVGLSLFVFILLFLAYVLFGQNISGVFRYSGTTMARFAEMLILSPDGIMGTPLGVSMEQIFYFLIFGAFFNACGGGQLLIDIGMYLGRKSVGGPAKAAVLSSSLMGTVSGSAVANVCSTGVFTIPLMKKNGYTAEEAGAIETISSTGGQIMPPIMGVGAFIMAEMLGVPYTRVATAAIIPAFMYYLAAFLVIHFITKRKIARNIDIKKLDYEVAPVLPRLHLLLPMVSLVYLIFSGRSLAYSATVSTLLVVVINLFDKKRRMKFSQHVASARDGVKQAVQIAIPTSACGVIIGIVLRSGVANKLSTLILHTGSQMLLFGLLLGALGCLLLGMAMPTAAAYLIATVIFVPTITKLGIAALPANMFIFYFGVIAQITPPVCHAAYAAAGISGGDIWKTGWKAFFMGSTAFLVPFVFIYKPEILLMGSVGQIILTTLVLTAGTACLACAVSGYLFKPIGWWQRVALGVTAVLVIMPETYSSLVGLAMEAAAVMYYFFATRKDAKKTNESIRA